MKASNKKSVFNSLLGSLGLVFLLASVLASTGCEPIPRRQLSAEEKKADLAWLYSMFGQFYAPLDYKAKLHRFNWEAFKAQTDLEAVQTKNNDEFYNLLMRTVSRVKDAHTSASLVRPDLPGRATVAYLGFSGERRGREFVVRELFPSVNAAGDSFEYPIRPGMVITHFNKMPIAEAVRRELVWSRDLGHDDANLTFHMNRLFTRLSLSTGLPKEDFAVLTVRQGFATRDVVMPWIVKDATVFEQMQAEAQAQNVPAKVLAGTTGKELYALLGFDGHVFSVEQIQKWITRGEFFDVRNTFRFVDGIDRWTTRLPVKSEESALDQVRTVPYGAMRIAEAKTFPAYVYKREGRMLGYVLVDTFSPEGPEGVVVAEFKATLERFKFLGVQHVVLDLINNGGGSLSLGMAIAQALTPKKIVMPTIELALRGGWIDDFEKQTGPETNDYKREVMRRLVSRLDADLQSGKRLSSRLPIELIVGREFSPNLSADPEMEYAVLVNEMCASMCDIFSAIVQDNGLGHIVGSQTMGAGGNVVEHSSAPNSHLKVRQTESLIVRRDGSYIENNGIVPDVTVDVSQYVDSQYREVREKAEEFLLSPACTPQQTPQAKGLRVFSQAELDTVKAEIGE